MDGWMDVEQIKIPSFFLLLLKNSSSDSSRLIVDPLSHTRTQSRSRTFLFCIFSNKIKSIKRIDLTKERACIQRDKPTH